MKASDKCKAMIKHHEGVRPKPYKCPAGLWTVGVGHLIGDGKTLPPEWNRTLSPDEVDSLLAADLRRFERGVLRLCPVDLTQGQFDALVSFSFNLGLGGLQRSSVRMCTNRGDKDGAVSGLMKYTKAGGKVLPGLVKRRQDESSLYMS
jgi:lysozyme